MRGQGACPRSQIERTGNPSSSPPRAGSASEGLALSSGSCEVTSSGVMGHETKSPACLWPRGSKGARKGLVGLKGACQGKLGGRELGLKLCDLGRLGFSLSLIILFGQRV